MKNVRRWLLGVVDWFEPFRYQNATYYSHARVRVTWWMAWVFHVCAVAVFGFFLTIATIGAVIFQMDYGMPPTAEYLIGMFASKACLQTNGCVPETLYGAVTAVGMMAIIISLLIFGLQGNYSLKPAKVTDRDLEELRMLGYIVMEAEDFENAINGRIAMDFADRRDIGGVPESGQLDQAGSAGGRPQPEGEGAYQLAEAH